MGESLSVTKMSLTVASADPEGQAMPKDFEQMNDEKKEIALYNKAKANMVESL
jgi:hypothetical protein